MESPSSPTVESSSTTMLNLNHQHQLSDNSNSNALFNMIYPFKLAQHNYALAPPPATLISPDSHSSHHTVLTVGGSLASPVLVTKHIVSLPNEGAKVSYSKTATTAGIPSKSHYIHPAPIVPKPTTTTGK
jgi:hypothetical protein